MKWFDMTDDVPFFSNSETTICINMLGFQYSNSGENGFYVIFEHCINPIIYE